MLIYPETHGCGGCDSRVIFYIKIITATSSRDILLGMEKYYVYQQVFLQGLQPLLDDTFHIVKPENLDEHRDKIVAICAPGGSKLSTIDEKLIESLPALKVISCFFVGYDHVDVQTAAKLGIRVGHTPFVLDDATADAAMTLLLGSAI